MVSSQPSLGEAQQDWVRLDLARQGLVKGTDLRFVPFFMFRYVEDPGRSKLVEATLG